MKVQAAIKQGALALGAFALVTAGSVGVIRALTAERIATNAEVYQQQKLREVLPPTLADVDVERILEGAFPLPEPQALGHRGSTQGWSIQAQDTSVVILPVVTREGYSGDIHLLVGVNSERRISGVRVTEHQETPGLGDKIERQRSDWVTEFNGLRLDSLPERAWAVTKDGGEFDTFTGATITPRAVVDAVYQALFYAERTPLPGLAKPDEIQEPTPSTTRG
ncbi:electron transport complex subunit RsxG [Halomonas vilamensis]|uniref:Ion-translocating oxidoreductase complex subunit G n=1 Tax=Vreelandella vilamensis TaxID=531309 RepID=A0ABU1H3M6_9GAMM|nr:electron transport complex subunit RsxG [Halomonas vilamensis]MDR5898431.1 electron transport complex subunit RsxG [Halomonas vilamensis]